MVRNAERVRRLSPTVVYTKVTGRTIACMEKGA